MVREKGPDQPVGACTGRIVDQHTASYGGKVVVRQVIECKGCPQGTRVRSVVIPSHLSPQQQKEFGARQAAQAKIACLQEQWDQQRDLVE